MAGRIPEHVIQQIGRSTDIVRLAGRYCDLKRKGKSHWGLCPFHKEKTPSFSVDPDNGLYYCFGCKEGGNVFTLLQKLEGMTFGEALRKLADEAGVDLRRYESTPGASRSELTKLREINELATSFYEKCLEKGRGGETARDYLAHRQISAGSVELWRLGYAPEGWDHFLKCACGRGYDPDLLVKAGLALPRQGAPGHYDRFRNRLMFPIADAGGRAIGFGARALKPEDEPKYLNSPDTPLFNKGSCFFGLSHAKEAIRSGKRAVVLEGYTDVIMAHQCGVTETLAVLGTAVTQDHARALSRICERVVLVFDPDEAGQRSAARSIEVLLNEELEILVATLPAGLDPCDYILAHGGEEFRKRLAESQGFFQFRLALARKKHDTETIEGRMAAFRDVAEIALMVRDDAGRDMIVRWLADELGVRDTSAWAYVQRNWRTAGTATRAAGTVTPSPGSARLVAEEGLPSELLGLLLCHPELVAEAAEQMDTRLLRDCRETTLLADLLARHRSGGPEEREQFVNSIPDADLASAATRAMAEERAREGTTGADSVRERFQGYLSYLERKRVRMAMARLPADDKQLRQYERMLKELDGKSAQPR